VLGFFSFDDELATNHVRLRSREWRARRSVPNVEVSAVPAATRIHTAFIQTARVLGQIRLVSEAFAALLLFDALARRGFERTHAFTRARQVARCVPGADTTSRVCAAVEEACVWYYKRAYCLQRSSVATWLLRRRGIQAELVIGFRPVPIDSHAWVEVGGVVVNDRPQYQKFFRVLDRL
jgi:hypothetical protein